VRKIAVIICILALPSVSFAQSKQASWSNLSRLQAGQKIQVVGTDSKKHTGTFASFTDTAISYHDAAGDQTIEKLNVSSVKLMEIKHRVRNSLIGAGVGVAAGAGIGVATGGKHDSLTQAANGILGAVIGIASGAVVGALLPTHDTIYDVSVH
jgi:hypothetical protein